MQKLLQIIKSFDFWILSFGWLSQLLSKIASEGFSNEMLLMQVFYWLSSVLALGKVNSVIASNRNIGSSDQTNYRSYTL